MINAVRQLSFPPQERTVVGAATVDVAVAPQATRQPLVSVIIPARGDVEPLMRGVHAVLNEQTLPRADIEVIVVDNGLRGTGALRRRFPEVVVVHEKGIGSYAARNRGVAEARGEFLAFTDADCIPSADWLERALTALKTADATLVGGIMEIVGSPGRLTCYERFERAMFDAARPERIVHDGMAVTANLVTYRHVFDRVGPFDARLRSSGDREWTQRAVAGGETLRHSADVRVRHPSRKSFLPIFRKIIRLRGGFVSLAKTRGFRSYAPLLRRFTLLDRNMYRAATSCSQGEPLVARLLFFGAVMVTATAATLETFRVLCGAKGYRG